MKMTDKPSAIMGNWSINLCSRLKWHFDYAFEMAVRQHVNVSHFAIDKDGRRLTLFWSDPGKMDDINVVALPYKMDYEAIRDFVWNWLKVAPYDRRPDIDGSTSKGFRVSTDYWGHALSHYGIVSVETEWALIGK